MRPALTRPTRSAQVSTRWTVYPWRANARARGRPTWPQPPTTARGPGSAGEEWCMVLPGVGGLVEAALPVVPAGPPPGNARRAPWGIASGFGRGKMLRRLRSHRRVGPHREGEYRAMFERISNSFALARSSWHVLRTDKKL